MRTRQSIVEMFATFLQFEAEHFNGWVYDAKLRRNIQNLLLQIPQTQSAENFWAIYWHKAWQTQPNSLALGHLSAYLQETCYWAVKRTIPQFASLQSSLSDCFQIAIAQVPKILKGCDPNQKASLKSYSTVAFGNIIRDALRQKQEIDYANDWALLLKLSRKRLQEALQNAGVTDKIITRYLLAWKSFTDGYILGKSPGVRKLQRPDQDTWDTITQFYNRDRLTLNPPEIECNAETLEKWLVFCAKHARAYLYPVVSSLNLPKLGQTEGELQDDLADNAHESLLASLIDQEEAETQKNQQIEIHNLLITALGKLTPQSQQLLQLYYQQGLIQQQIAQQQQIQQYQVSRQLAKARESLLLAITKWGQETMHISPTSNVVKYISVVLEEWLQNYFRNLESHSSEEK
ncbi:sigma-70 family RNA polymerase sigma factor [Anabaena cylindrica FACHB-243]|uniref:RNA polymerase sigma factor, sigma-70 family n=1 Tax=Anabaena cylindrica (strain ATCC 27899 / PCC 7122) TaxID=272123 RepID=K9Z9B1_ANACC|nr:MULTISPECIES: sigma-70 family RNA polymerase sigma factor [Anabaena]AFZ55778.1 RNA polymerase sigma factor, sigma-70 family [Anabaena cylindrica PCC 7122]MBD2420221.1 sigma-70 family RNA polymerase sigma factor [Anabaena cylindrica FACHB-243]MBY5283092.1 sigma-70 family RNA polymerase sigma factor [Anabaena sp. CCAP 1446/1C]MBY5307809.1 sigma-70 family RNA polymerase sigma factor [Anabaena sp. CCAP 1446/1C]MCM2406127.1 sigma-70 family RNA polymerase sigma factor [Anabaena sp. CCAP 1446/1C]